MMNQFFKPKPRDKGGAPSLQFYVEFLGWLPCLGIRGSIYTNSIAYELIERKKKYPVVPKMTLQVSAGDIKFSTDNPGEHRKEKITSVKYPCIMLKDVTYAAVMAEPHGDIATCIFVGYNPTTRSMLHTHVYQFDSPGTAMTFVDLLNKTVSSPQHQDYVYRVEEQLRRDGYLNASVAKPPPSAAKLPRSPMVERHPVRPGPGPGPGPEPEAYISPEMKTIQDMTKELKQKFEKRDGPILLPPKDYDTIRRKQGKLDGISNRKSLNTLIVGGADVDDSESFERDVIPESKEPPMVYPPKQAPEDNLVYPTNSAASPVIIRKDNSHRRQQRESHGSSFLSNSSGGSDRNYRASYTPPATPSSPNPALKQGHQTIYEVYPTLKNSDRGHIANSSPDLTKKSTSHHTRENSMSSTHSGLSSISDIPYIQNETDYEIPPDYDESPAKSSHNNMVPRDGHPGYGNQFGNHGAAGNDGASVENPYSPRSPSHVQPDDIYARPIRRRNGGLSD